MFQIQRKNSKGEWVVVWQTPRLKFAQLRLAVELQHSDDPCRIVEVA
jgi:hypothetical protein